MSTEHLSERRRRFPVPRSLLGRMLLLTLLAVLFAQALSSVIWVSQLRATQLEGLVTSARSLAHSMTASVSYFRSLPVAYRPLVLDQLRSMGGTRFVVTLNDRPLDMAILPQTPRKQAVLKAVDEVLRQTLGADVHISVEFVSAEDLRIFNAGLKLDELPRSWAHYALTLEPVNPPVLVTQIQLAPGEWLYIASLLPEPYTSLEEQGLPSQQVWFIVLTSGFLLLFIGLLVHWQSRPLKRLARAARDMSLGADVEPVAEGGGSEVVEVGRAFNAMRERISRYLTERSQLFSAISHDLRTPITRLRLRVELLEDENLQTKFGRDLDELELLVKGALQCVKDTDIHENIEPVDLNHVLDCLVEPYLAPNGNGRVTQHGRALAPYPGKPLALKRCIGNLIDNALKYGQNAHLHIEDDGAEFILHVDDEGPGVPEQRLEQVFEPHFRLAGQQQGYGLGLGIARNIAHSHGGEVSLQNLREGGLRVTLQLPRTLD
ncbi:HAMP domain-containing protein [Pseudomonas veronii]|uniref:histidine kinase n=1 Tax=Pseudomonas veronii 1YdBTEX2 TaxID=1295141 RepID=A0A1D3K2X1_PSEVE|nr:two-component sensor histidine kinase [Pseudomonas veronii]PMU92370.1 HAMP domain-containing protein [Pseudomonas sp. GW704-F3]PMU94867.1 HAMP domain-containing protein [Pseudomonas sp. GW704-F5]PMU99645.1 HAMP domain-containing protein [Pseudomonas sp. MPBD4-3]PMV34513.1 HAMP domain-containing protein [Pseudomonas sp. GW704-F2]PUB36142.1 signal transduction histidine kinase [Pseudomonas sp. GV105]SBW82704.1 histidine kinase [Pseudomonas veronii 1YdBTEX2]SEB35101.1 Signal transduction his